MSVGYSLHLGLNRIDPNHYAGTAGRLDGPEYDATAMRAIADSNNFVSKILLTSEVTRDNVISYIRDAASKLISGDIFLLTYSGHGGLLPNLNGDLEPVGYDQTWCLYDAQFIDDELKRLWAGFDVDVRILVISDSCYSGSLLKFHGLNQHVKSIDSRVLKQIYNQNKTFYDKILTRPNIQDLSIKSSVILLSSCKDSEESFDGPYNSVFTKHLLSIWNNGEFNGNYKDFVNNISNDIRDAQTPQLQTLGVRNNEFINSIPFKI